MKTITNNFGSWVWPEKDYACWEAVFREVPKLQKVLELVKNRSICVQAGGNCGVFAKYLSVEFKYVYTFEPDPTNYLALISNCPQTNVFKFPTALGSEHNCIDLERDEANCGAYQVSGNGLIPTLRIDDLNLPACDLMFLDIEGMEYQALMGGEKTIDQFHPVIVTEEKSLGSRYGADEDTIRNYLRRFGYKQVDRLENDSVYVSG